MKYAGFWPMRQLYRFYGGSLRLLVAAYFYPFYLFAMFQSLSSTIVILSLKSRGDACPKSPVDVGSGYRTDVRGLVIVE